MRASCRQTWDIIRDAFQILTSLRILRRFCDSRNDIQEAVALSDGSNIECPGLQRSWLLYRALIRALHYRSLHIGRENYGVAQIEQILMLTCAFLHQE